MVLPLILGLIATSGITVPLVINTFDALDTVNSAPDIMDHQRRELEGAINRQRQELEAMINNVRMEVTVLVQHTIREVVAITDNTTRKAESFLDERIDKITARLYAIVLLAGLVHYAIVRGPAVFSVKWSVLMAAFVAINSYILIDLNGGYLYGRQV